MNDTTRTPAPLTAGQLADIRTRANAATPGPWGTYHENPQSDYSRLIDIAADLQDTNTGYRCRRYIGQLESGQIDNDPAHRDWDADQDNEQSAADAEFVAHAREDVPALLTEIDRLRDELAARPTRAEELREISDAIAGLDFNAVTRSLPRAAELSARLRAMANAAEQGATQGGAR